MVKIICETSNGLYSIQPIKDISINDLEESPISETIYQKLYYYIIAIYDEIHRKNLSKPILYLCSIDDVKRYKCENVTEPCEDCDWKRM